MLSEHVAGVLEHRKLVATHLSTVIGTLIQRGIVHDDSKFSPQELEAFEQVTPHLKTIEYGSDAYKAALQELGPALQHHYRANSHHPEHFKDGIGQMSLIDLIEMLCDWMAAVQRVNGGDIYKSLEINKERFGIDDQLYGILCNTVFAMTGSDGKTDPNTLYPDVLLTGPWEDKKTATSIAPAKLADVLTANNDAAYCAIASTTLLNGIEVTTHHHHNCDHADTYCWALHQGERHIAGDEGIQWETMQSSLYGYGIDVDAAIWTKGTTVQ